MRYHRKLGAALFAGALAATGFAAAPAFAQSKIEITAPGDGQIVPSGNEVRIHINAPSEIWSDQTKAFHIILDDQMPQHFKPSKMNEEFVLKNVGQGSHLVRLFLVEHNTHFAVDGGKLYDTQVFAVGQKSEDKLPEKGKPILTLNLPHKTNIAEYGIGNKVPVDFFVSQLDGNVDSSKYKLKWEIAGKNGTLDAGKRFFIEGLPQGRHEFKATLVEANGQAIQNKSYNQLTRPIEIGAQIAHGGGTKYPHEHHGMNEPKSTQPVPAGSRDEITAGEAVRLNVTIAEGQHVKAGQPLTLRVESTDSPIPAGWLYIVVVGDKVMEFPATQKELRIDALPAGTQTVHVFVSRPNYDMLKQASAHAVASVNVGRGGTSGDPAAELGKPAIFLISPKDMAYPEGKPLQLAFFVQGVKMDGGVMGNMPAEAPKAKVIYSIDGKETTLEKWEYTQLKDLPAGRHTIELRLVGENGQPIANALNNGRVSRSFTIGDTAAQQPNTGAAKAPAEMTKEERRQAKEEEKRRKEEEKRRRMKEKMKGWEPQLEGR